MNTTLIKTVGNYSVHAVDNEWIVRDDRANAWFDCKRWKNYANAVKVATAANACDTQARRAVSCP